MNLRRLSPSSARMGGLSLIELLVSMAIGLILMVAIVSAYLGAAGSSRIAEAQGRMNEDAQAALSILTQQLRMAGGNPKQPSYAPDTPRNPIPAGNWGIRGCDGTFGNVTTAADIGSLTCAGGGGADSIAVSYEGDAYNTVKNAANQATDCLGQALPAITVPVTAVPPVKAWNAVTGAVEPIEAVFRVADSRFYIGTTAAVTNPSLFCKGNGGASPQPLVENVEDLQLTYGVAPSTAVGTLTVAGYLTAAEILTQATLAALPDDATRWSKVATVRICIVVRSEQPAAPDAASAQYVNCSGNTVAAPDLRLRRAYSTTVVLRNRVIS